MNFQKVCLYIVTIIITMTCASCSSDQYTYEPQTIQTYPGENDMCSFDSFYSIKQGYRSAVGGNESVLGDGAVTYNDHNNDMNERDVFMTVYDILKDCTILVPKNSDIILDGIRITATGVSDVEITLYYWLPSDVRISFTMVTLEATKKHQAQYESWEYAIPEIYKGTGFEGHVQSSSPKSTLVRIVTDTNHGYLDGYIVVGDDYNVPWQDLFENDPTIEDIAGVLDNFKAVNFHKTVQSAKEPK